MSSSDSSVEASKAVSPISEKYTSDENQRPSQKTIASMIGEIVWLMSQSSIHRTLSLADLEWILMPPIALGQYKLFRDEKKKPIGAALWGYLNEEAEKKLKVSGRLAPQDWGNDAELNGESGLLARPGGTPWLVELVAPFHSESNGHRDQMISDLLSSVFSRRSLKLMHFDSKTGRREELVLGAN